MLSIDLKFYNSYLYWKDTSFSSGSTNNTDYSYYRYWTLPISTATGSTNCGDGTGYYSYNIHHPTTVVTTGLTLGVYSLNITMPTIINNITPNPCDLSCDNTINNFVNNINNSSTGTTNQRSIYSDNGASYSYPLGGYTQISRNNTSRDTLTSFGYLNINVNSLNTIPASGTSNTIIPSLSGQVCDYNTHGYLHTLGYPSNRNGEYTFIKYLYRIKVQLTNPSDVRDFNIYMSPITNFVYSGFPGVEIYDLAYSYSGGSAIYSNPTYII